MELNPGMLVYVNHYSGKKPIVSSIVGTVDNDITVIFTEKLKSSNVFRNDPVVLNFESEKKLYTCEGYIKEINAVENIMELRIDNSQEMDNNRLFERFPVSLYATIMTVKNKKHIGVVKNISVSGFAIATKCDLKIGTTYDFEIYVDERVIAFKGEVAWKKNNEPKNEYGIRSIYPDYVVKNMVKIYLTILKNEQENSVKPVM